jgi:N-glycosylase/DNA lyase
MLYCPNNTLKPQMSTKPYQGAGVQAMSLPKERNENYSNAVKELTRADHLLYVSLKYSRTVDVIHSVVNRLVEAGRFAIIAGLETHYADEEELKRHMHGNATQVKAVLKAYPDLKDHIEFYRFLRKLNKADIKQRLNEFRRHVTMVADLEGTEVRVKIEDVSEYYEKVKDFLKAIHVHVHGDEEDLLSRRN